MPIDYLPYDDKTQPDWQIPRYPKSFTRVPKNGFVERPLTRTELTGPDLASLAQRLSAGPLDLSRSSPGSPARGVGQLIRVTGRVTDEDERPIAGAVIELWQANSAGKYVHELDRHAAPLDPCFNGQGRLVTDKDGRYEFLSIKPGGYPVGESQWWWRPPHIHFSIFGPSWMDRYITQIFFPGEPLNEIDLLLNGVQDPEARERLIFKFGTPEMGQTPLIPYSLDFVLRGSNATPTLG